MSEGEVRGLQELVRLLTEERDQWMARAHDLERTVARQREELRKLNSGRRDITQACEQQKHDILMGLLHWISYRVVPFGPEGRGALRMVMVEIDRRLAGPQRPSHNPPHEGAESGGSDPAAGSADGGSVRGAEGDVAPRGP